MFDHLLPADVFLQVRPQHVEEREEHRQLQQERQARGERVDFALLVELHHLLLLALFVLLVLLFQRLDLGRHALHLLHRLQLPEGQRHEDRSDQDRQSDDRQSPAATQKVVVQEDHDRFEDADQRRKCVLDDVCENWHALDGLLGSSAVGGACGTAADTGSGWVTRVPSAALMGSGPEKSLSLDGIVAAVAPRVAPEQAPPCEHRAPSMPYSLIASTA